MSIDISPDLAAQLHAAALRLGLSESELVQRALVSFLAGSEAADDLDAWVRTTQANLDRAWGVEDFRDWRS
jgi:hypothetical protein